MTEPLVEVLAEALRNSPPWYGSDANDWRADIVLAALREHPDLLLTQLVEWGVLEEYSAEPTNKHLVAVVDQNGRHWEYGRVYHRTPVRAFVARQQEERADG